MMQLAWATLGAKRNRRVNNFDLADCKVLAKIVQLLYRPAVCKYIASELGIGCPAAAFMVKLWRNSK